LSASVIKYWVFSLITAVFGLVYAHFSHGVFSGFMTFAFLIPLFGVAAQLLPAFRRRSPFLWNCGILTLTVGCLLQGVLDIYGTTNWLCGVYWVVGGGFLLLALLVSLFGREPKNE